MRLLWIDARRRPFVTVLEKTLSGLRFGEVAPPGSFLPGAGDPDNF
jgi:hypothetical protein